MARSFIETEEGPRPYAPPGSTWENIAAMTAILRAKQTKPSPDISSLWGRQKQTKEIDTVSGRLTVPRLTLDMVDRISWMVDSERLNDFGPNIMQEFRLSAALDSSFAGNEQLRHIPEKRLRELYEIISRPPEAGMKGPRMLAPDQAALIFHISRTNGSMRACREIFNEPFNVGAVSCTRMFTRNFLGHLPKPGWNWAP